MKTCNMNNKVQAHTCVSDHCFWAVSLLWCINMEGCTDGDTMVELLADVMALWTRSRIENNT